VKHIKPNGGEGGSPQIQPSEAMERSREPESLRTAPRCLARTRRGTACQSPATPKGRCRMHGGAPGSGGPSGPRNGMWKHGRYSQEMAEHRRAVRQLLRAAKETLESF
jgi:hypothetical protein